MSDNQNIMRLEDTTSINGMIDKINEIIEVLNKRNGASVEACEHVWCSREENPLHVFCYKCGQEDKSNEPLNTNEQSDKCEHKPHPQYAGDVLLNSVNEQSDEVADLTQDLKFSYSNDSNHSDTARFLLLHGYSKHSKTERCDVKKLDWEKLSLFLFRECYVEDIETSGHMAKAICSHFTAPNVKDDRDKLIIAMKEEILILRANVKQLEDEQQKRCELDENKLTTLLKSLRFNEDDFFNLSKGCRGDEGISDELVDFLTKAILSHFTAPNVKRLSVNDLRLFYANWTGKHRDCDDSRDFAKQLHQRIYEHKEV